MAQIKIERIISFSSEDPNHTAQNLLTKDFTKKWICKTEGERCVSIILQLDQPYLIGGIDIGAVNSAFVEILVCRSISPEDYKTFLPMTPFLTAIESRQILQNIDKVRMFKTGDFCDSYRKEKWDRIKINCTQPFNRHVKYGLGFIYFCSLDEKLIDLQPSSSVGQFIIRPDSPDNFSAGSLFARRKQLLAQDAKNKKTLTGAAEIREASSLAQNGSPLPKQKITHKLPIHPPNKEQNNSDGDRKDRNRNELLYTKDDEEKHEKIDKIIKKRDEEKEKKIQKEDKEKHTKKIKDNKPSTPQKPSSSSKKTPPDKKLNNPNKYNTDLNESLKRKLDTSLSKQKISKRVKTIPGKPFSKLLEDVVLVISGIQNPDRGNLRKMALSMGAKYKSDWDGFSTHLICAFVNTPKFNQVKGKGKIVTRKWIEECYKERKKLPWRRFALDRNDKGPESEDEICEKVNSPSSFPVNEHENNEDYEINSDSAENDDDDTKEPASDTDEKIAEILDKKNNLPDIYAAETDNESCKSDKCEEIHEIETKFKNFFSDKIFYVDENLEEKLVKKIKQYVAAYNGIVTEHLEPSIDIVISDNKNYGVFKDIYGSVPCVSPDWVWKCHNAQEFVPFKDFLFE